MLTYNVLIAALTIGSCCALSGAYAFLSRHTATTAQRYIRYAEIILICAICGAMLLSISGLTDHLQPV